jgi:hypothetical protein
MSLLIDVIKSFASCSSVPFRFLSDPLGLLRDPV